MQLYDIANILNIILFIVVVLVIILIVSFLTLRKRDMAYRNLSVFRDEVRKYREQRLILIEQAVAMFSQDNKFAPSLVKLAEIYRTIDKEEKEIYWEDRYIKVMKKFLVVAKKTAPANMQASWKMLNTSVNENETSLDVAREAYVQTKETIEKFDTFPQKYILLVGDKLSLLLKYAEYTNKQYHEQLKKREAEGETIEQESNTTKRTKTSKNKTSKNKTSKTKNK